MQNFEIIETLQAAAESLGWFFIYGYDRFYQNIESDKHFTAGKLVLIADFKAFPTIKNGVVQSIRYECLIMLGRKFETTTHASLEELPLQKYNNRLGFLTKELVSFISNFACSNELDVVSCPITVEINAFDSNLDFAVCQNAVFNT